jgi:hypothetical protein
MNGQKAFSLEEAPCGPTTSVGESTGFFTQSGIKGVPMEKQTLIQRLKEIVGPEYVLHSDMDLTLYGYDASLMKGKPDLVVIPSSTEEVSKVVALAYQEKIPVIGRGSGTNLSGGTVALKGGIVIHFSRMKRILEVDLPNRTVTVEPGIITLDLQNLLQAGIVYARLPVRGFTLGGNFGENSAASLSEVRGDHNHVLGAELSSTTAPSYGPAASPRTLRDMTSQGFWWEAREPSESRPRSCSS